MRKLIRLLGALGATTVQAVEISHQKLARLELMRSPGDGCIAGAS